MLYFIRYFVVIASMFVTMSADAQIIRNPENDPDLKLALKYDSEQCDPERRSVIDQRKAIFYYQKYLEKVTDIDRRVRILVQIGVKYNTSYEVTKGEKPDFVKAREHFQKALDLDSVHINKALLRARFGMVSPAISVDEEIDVRIKNYKWIRSFDDEKLNEFWLSDTKGVEARGSEMKYFRTLMTNVEESEVNNMTYASRYTKDPLKTLQKIIKELAGTPAEKSAQKELDKRVRTQTEKLTQSIESITDIAVTPELTLPVVAVELDSKPKLQVEKRPSITPSVSRSLSMPWIVGIGLAVFLLLFIIYKKTIVK